MSDAMDSLYNAIIVEHDRSPHNEGALPDATHTATADNPMCGDTVTMHAVVEDGRVVTCTFEARGCALCRAAASLLTVRIRGTTIDEVGAVVDTFERFLVDTGEQHALELGDLVALGGARRVRSRRVCALLPFRAIAKALS